MSLLQRARKVLIALSLVFILVTSTACGATATSDRTISQPKINSPAYSQIERGNTTTGQNFGDWVVQASGGLVQDAYVRDSDKLGVVISPKVSPSEVRPLAKSLAQGFQKNFPNRDLKVLVYAPDKKLILTANYNSATRQIQYDQAVASAGKAKARS